MSSECRHVFLVNDYSSSTNTPTSLLSLLPHRGQAAAHVPVGHGEAGLVDGLLEDQVDDPFEPLLCVDGQVGHLLHQLVEFLRRQLVQDATYLPEELLMEISGKKKQTNSSSVISQDTSVIC